MAHPLTEKFNASAERFLAREIQAPLLLTRYGLMLKFQAKSPEDKAAMVGALCDAALKGLQARSDTGYTGYLGDSDQDGMQSLLKALQAPESASYLSPGTPDRLAEIGLKFVQRAEIERDFSDRNNLTSYARICLEYADAFALVIQQRNDELATSKNITPARRIVLKRDGGGGP